MRSLYEFLMAYLRYDPAAKSLLEVFFLYPGPRAIFFYKIAHFLYRLRLYFLARLVSELGRFLSGVEIHPGAVLGCRLVIDHGMGLVIGETAVVGDDCILFHGVTLGGNKFEPVKRHPTIGDRVLIGAGAKVLGAITIGSGSKIGANSVVLDSFPENSVIVGAPARSLSAAISSQ